MENRKCRVNLVGIGMGSKGTLTEEVRKIIAESDVLIGAMRMLEGFREKKKCCYAEYLPESLPASAGNVQTTGHSDKNLPDFLPDPAHTPDQYNDKHASILQIRL